MAISPKAETKDSGDMRSLTEGEIELARQYFGDKIDYTQVKIGKKSGILGALTGDNAVTPDGNIHMPENAYKADYSKASLDEQAHFMHEMTHVWQKQAGRSVVAEAATQFIKNAGDYKKAYQDDGSVAFKDMNLEQQGEFVAAAVKSGGAAKYMSALQAAGLGPSEQDVAEAPQAERTTTSRRTSPDPAGDALEADRQRAGGEQLAMGSMVTAQAGGRIAGEPMQDMVAEAEAAGRRIAAHSLAARQESDRKGEQLLAEVQASLMGDMKGMLYSGAGEAASAHPSGLSGGAAKQGQLFSKG